MLEGERPYMLPISQKDVLFFEEQDYLSDGKIEHLAAVVTRNPVTQRTNLEQDGNVSTAVFPFRIYVYVLQQENWLFKYTVGLDFDNTESPTEATFRDACFP
jgi:hypothetical protein